MNQQTADLNVLLYHLKRCPSEFLFKPVIFQAGLINTRALVLDVFRKVAGNWIVPDTQLPAFLSDSILDENHALAVQIASWFFGHEFFEQRSQYLEGIDSFIFKALPEVCEFVNSKEWITDEDRAEEFVRLALQCCNVTPSGETSEEALDRFYAVSTLKRLQVLRQTSEAMQRIKEIRQKMAENKAREASNVYGRE